MCLRIASMQGEKLPEARAIADPGKEHFSQMQCLAPGFTIDRNRQ
jgi:hypothetical protein